MLCFRGLPSSYGKIITALERSLLEECYTKISFTLH